MDHIYDSKSFIIYLSNFKIFERKLQIRTIDFFEWFSTTMYIDQKGTSTNLLKIQNLLLELDLK